MILSMGIGWASMKDTSPDKEIAIMLVDFQVAIKAGDIDKIMDFYSNDFTNSYGVNKDIVRSSFEGMVAQGTLQSITILDLEEGAITVNGDYATVTPLVVGNPMGRIIYRCTLKKETDGVWRMISTDLEKHPHGYYSWYWHNLIFGSKNVNKKIVEAFLAAGAKVDGSSALREAAKFGHIEVVEVLLAAGAKVDGSSALREAAKFGHKEVVELLLGAGAKVDGSKALREASKFGHKEVVELLLEAGAKVDGSAALREAAKFGHKEVVELLLGAGAKVDGSTALREASKFGHKEVVEVLLGAGAKVDGSAALREAAKFGHKEVVEVLLAAGAEVDQ